jgi:regulator of PEP synthase PpsR (kinase-PPPase family)
MSGTKRRTVFFISDGTGITAEALGHSLLAQFDGMTFERKTIPYVDSKEKALQAVERINHCAQIEPDRPIVFDTVVDQDIRDLLAQSQGYLIDIFSTFLKPLELELQASSSYTVGRSHAIVNSQEYLTRMEAINFAVDNDDGARIRHYDSADVIVIGVSRSGKTPTCLYLALQFGVRAANYPITDEDLEDNYLPKCLGPYRAKIFGLSIDPDRLASIRHERRPNSRYASPRQCEMEVQGLEALYNQEKIPYLNSTHYSIEEISTRLMEVCELPRRIKST